MKYVIKNCPAGFYELTYAEFILKDLEIEEME
jgi:hypothetical protein